MTIELVSYADIKAFVGLEETGITEYPSLGVIQSSVVEAIETYLCRSLEYGAYTQSIQVMGQTSIIGLDALPVDSIESVTVTQYGEDTALNTDDYFITEYGIYLYAPVSMCRLAIEYDGGYTTSTIPGAIKRAALLQTIFEFQTKDNVGASSVSTDGGSVQTPELGLLKEVKRLLNPFKHQLAWS